MIGQPTLRPRTAGAVADWRIGGLGDPGTRLLAGPQAECGAESFERHLDRVGPLPGCSSSELLARVSESGLQGRGGGGFPLAKKLEAALGGDGEPIVVVNASESEPASRKDRMLCTYRPHLVLDGAVTVASIVGASEVVVHLHRGSYQAIAGVEGAVAERKGAPDGGTGWRLSLGPDRYVAGESSAIASFLHGGEALPNFSAHPMAVRGPSGRPTIVCNAETMAQLGTLLRMSPEHWRTGGPPGMPGTQLVTAAGAVAVPGLVLEVIGQASIGEILGRTGLGSPPAAVLTGGYAGTWIEGDVAWQAPFERTALRCLGAHTGCGLIGVMPHGACGLVETARLVRYLADESAGQCGSCANGLPKLAASLEELAGGTLRRRGIRKVEALGDTILGSGACGHPDGVVRLVRSMLAVFEDDVVRHLAGRACRASSHPPVFPVPNLAPALVGRS